jgi:hypothetical protein
MVEPTNEDEQIGLDVVRSIAEKAIDDNRDVFDQLAEL